MKLRTNSRNVTNDEAPQLSLDARTAGEQPAGNPVLTHLEDEPSGAPDMPDPQLRFNFADGGQDRPVAHDTRYPSLSGSDDTCDNDDRVIMVVDDDHAIREALRDLLGLLGFSVVSACDGEDALAMLGDGCQPYAILLDLGMPRMDGWRFRSELLSDPRYAGLRVIVITASDNQRPEMLGVSDVLTKPVPLQRLVEVLGTQHRGV